ncbi:MAG TPA: hydroxymethylglutaryl-CoA lyase [Candidatus Dormibacteraeota bacterium]|nr:hydroxymethylglutaryl-CoA lyase [Candidatus Dormibacteraeota bacterium]
MGQEGGGTGGQGVVFTEVGPRDGFQNLKETLPTADKLAVIEGLLATGVDCVEVTSFVSPAWVPQLADAEAVCRALDPARLRDRVRVLVPNRRGLERALAAGVGHVLVTIGVTDGFNRRNVNCSVDQSLGQLGEIVAAAEGAVDVSLSVAFGCPFEGAVAPARTAALARACLDAGAAEVGLADTIGVADPAQVRALLGAVVSAGVPLDRISLHLHDTRGMGLANVLAGWEAGVRRFEGSVGGIGGCPFSPRATGNVCSEDLLHLLARMGAGISADLGRYCQVATQVAALLDRELPGRLHRAGLWDGRPVSEAPAG